MCSVGSSTATSVYLCLCGTLRSRRSSHTRFRLFPSRSIFTSSLPLARALTMSLPVQQQERTIPLHRPEAIARRMRGWYVQHTCYPIHAERALLRRFPGTELHLVRLLCHFYRTYSCLPATPWCTTYAQPAISAQATTSSRGQSGHSRERAIQRPRTSTRPLKSSSTRR